MTQPSFVPITGADQVRPALLQFGMSPEFADSLLEMSAALNSGYLRMRELRSALNTTPTSLETFVREEFAPQYREGKTRVA